MTQILFAEHLKMKRTMAKKLLLFAPAITLGISFLSGSLFYSCAFNWWYTMFFPVVLAMMCNQIQEQEKKRLDYRNVSMSPVPFLKIWSCKAFLAAGYSLFCCIFLALIITGCESFLGKTMQQGIGAAFLAGILISLSCSYQIPLYMFLAKRFHFLAPLLLSIVLVAAGILYSEKAIWIMIPPAWCNRLMYSILHIMTNGLFVQKEQEHLLVGSGSIVLSVFMSLILFILGTLLTGYLEEREMRRR